MNLDKIVSLIHSAMCSHMTHYGIEPETLYLNNADWRLLKAAWEKDTRVWQYPPQLELFDDYIPPNTRLYGTVVEAHPTDSYVCHREQMFQGGAYHEKTTEVSFK